MEVIESIDQIRDIVKGWRRAGEKVALVPTMGYLHEGHASLIKKAANENDKVVVSIFVNPTQFGPGEDLEKYPRDLIRDKEVCIESGANIIFHPNKDEMYAKDFLTYVDINELGNRLCGKSRPVHFRGVCTVVTKLFNIIPAHNAYFGEKDAQQLAIIKGMVKDLNIDIKVIGCPIIREKDGLAKSSRNVYLSVEEREAALVLNKALLKARSMLGNGICDSKVIINEVISIIESEKLAKIDYVEIVDGETLKEIDIIDRDILVAIAVVIGKTRLIDNFSYSIKVNDEWRKKHEN